MQQQSIAQQPLFIAQGKIPWHTPLWINYLPVAIAMSYNSKWGGYGWVWKAIRHLGATALRFWLILCLWGWLL